MKSYSFNYAVTATILKLLGGVIIESFIAYKSTH